jgi:hypothetical protein
MGAESKPVKGFTKFTGFLNGLLQQASAEGFLSTGTLVVADCRLSAWSDDPNVFFVQTHTSSPRNGPMLRRRDCDNEVAAPEILSEPSIN